MEVRRDTKWLVEEQNMAAEGRKVVIKTADMADSMQQDAIECAQAVILSHTCTSLNAQ